MKTTLEVFCEAVGWKGGTIHQAKDRFAVASLAEMDTICGLMVDSMASISDIENVSYFTNKRLEAIGLHSVSAVRGLK